MFFKFDESYVNNARMKVIGIGGAGGNAVNRMIEAGLTGVEFISVNTDAMALDANLAQKKVQIGERITKGLGAGANPEIGRLAMEEDRDVMAEHLRDSEMVFLTAGMGGGTGTGGLPVVAQIAQEMGILTVAIITKPFLFEGKIRDRNAKYGIDELRKYVDTTIIIPNQRLLSIVDKQTSFIEAFRIADEVLHQSTKGISDLINIHGMINLDFADVQTVMKNGGDALMGSGVASGENRAVIAAENAINSPLLEDICISGATGVIVNVTSGEDLTLFEVGEAMEIINESVGEEVASNIIYGTVIDKEMKDQVRITVIATGFDESTKQSANRKEKIVSTPITSQDTDTSATNEELSKQNSDSKLAFNINSNQVASKNNTTRISSDSESTRMNVPPYIREEVNDMNIPTYLRKQMQ